MNLPIPKSMIDDNNVFLRGKHVGKSVDEVLNNHYDYLIWLKDQTFITRDERLFSQIKHLQPKPYKMPWGRHKGLTIEELYHTDSDYFKWLTQNDLAKNNKRLWAEILKFSC